MDEVGQYVASNVELILNVQGMMQIFKDEFRGNVWVIATAQQTLTEDNRQAQLNSNELFRLNDRFPIKVDIEANDIKEIITKRLLGKSQEGKEFLVKLFNQNEGILKNNTHLAVQQRSIYNQVLTEQSFADLYPFLPVHIDILLSLLQKLASRTGGVGLRSVIRLIRDILVDNHLADATMDSWRVRNTSMMCCHLICRRTQPRKSSWLQIRQYVCTLATNWLCASVRPSP